MNSHLTPIDPVQLHRSPAFTQGMLAPAGPTPYVGGQNGADSAGNLLEGLEAQTEQALRNVFVVLDAAETAAEHVAKVTINLAVGIDPTDVYSAPCSVGGDRRTAVTVLAVNRARPGALVEVEAIATTSTPLTTTMFWLRSAVIPQ